MKDFFKKIRDIYSHEELRKKIGFTLLLLLIYRIGSFIILPGIDQTKLDAGEQGGILAFLGLFTGGAFSRASIFALGVMPYISASIVVQLLGLAVPSIQKLQKEGESGRKKITQWTRFLTILIAIVQAPSYITQYVPSDAVVENSGFWIFSSVVILTCSTLFVMWLGEKITDKGIGNGTSLIIMIGIISDIPRGLYTEATTQTPFFFLIELAFLLVIIGAVVAITQAIRRIPVQMARANAGGAGFLPQGEGARSYIPLRVNSAGVMPIIFAQAIMFIPALLQNNESLQGSKVLQSLTDFQGVGYNVLLFVMIILFTFFYTAIVTNPNQIADDLKRNGNFVPGVKPGKPTAEFIDKVLSNITLPGGIFVALIAILPALVMMVGLTKSQMFGQFFGGTSLLITVGVVLDLLQQIESHLLSRHYDGLMKTGRVRGRNTNAISTGYTG